MFLLTIISLLAGLLAVRGLYQILGYQANLNVAANTPTDTPAIATGENNFTPRNGHWIFTEPYDLCAAGAFGATLTQAQLYDATYNATNVPQIYPVNLGITPLTNPNLMDLRRQPWPIPMNEEFACQLSGGAGGAEDDYGLIWIAPSGQNAWMTPPPTPSLGAPRVYADTTFTTATTTHIWSPGVAMTFTNTLKGGLYQMNGAYVVIAHTLAYKIIFPKTQLYMGRKLTPGNLVENAYGNVPLMFRDGWLGAMGLFNYFELPQISILASTTEGSATYHAILDLTYLGNSGTPGSVPGT